MKYIINRVAYDYSFDILYVYFKDLSNSYGDEDLSHLVIFKDFDTDEVTGLLVYDFKSLFKRNDLILNEISKYIDPSKIYNQYVS